MCSMKGNYCHFLDSCVPVTIRDTQGDEPDHSEPQALGGSLGSPHLGSRDVSSTAPLHDSTCYFSAPFPAFCSCYPNRLFLLYKQLAFFLTSLHCPQRQLPPNWFPASASSLPDYPVHWPARFFNACTPMHVCTRTRHACTYTCAHNSSLPLSCAPQLSAASPAWTEVTGWGHAVASVVP